MLTDFSFTWREQNDVGNQCCNNTVLRDLEER